MDEKARAPLETANSLKWNIALYLHQYWQHQWLAATRGLLPGIPPNNTDVPPASSFEPGELQEDDKLLLARLSTVQKTLDGSFAQLHAYLQRVKSSLLETRVKLWIGSILGLLFAGSVLIWTLIPSKRFRPLVMLIPSPITIYVLTSRERNIRRTKSAIGRISYIRRAVARSAAVPREDAYWIRQDRWDGVDWDRVGL
ncbi:hypothetical protein Dda_2120 [Drechslerella dactyloides]|uniref:Uncharacterized protein n=1 Tax=Drechslerella dactyloides TaxID=74499 RepID=A0AAD6J3U6_DREDA|nr:hypothetical protein Dda_2120 [Drechslerella dactyloides]